MQELKSWRFVPRNQELEPDLHQGRKTTGWESCGKPLPRACLRQLTTCGKEASSLDARTRPIDKGGFNRLFLDSYQISSGRISRDCLRCDEICMQSCRTCTCQELAYNQDFPTETLYSVWKSTVSKCVWLTFKPSRGDFVGMQTAKCTLADSLGGKRIVC
ncbi:hypothetical protein BGZ60DRAFT_274952 [Tricladium varicosporioides]|nr:hypothetical protein BGZ60DRAFT_274952 [Hymenoscyphus varicosporioides]